jgi:SAM-dependent methyltransferase
LTARGLAEAPRHIARYSLDNVASDTDGRLFSPAFERNFAPIRAALGETLAETLADGGSVLEIGSGTGQHIAHLAQAFPGARWIPSDIEEAHLASIAAWGRWLGVANMAAPLTLDAAGNWAADWAADPDLAAAGSPDAVLSANVVHIAPWAVAGGIVRFAGWFRGYGRIVIVDHGDGFHSISGHLDEIYVKVGVPVEEGEALGTVGETGSLGGPSLYFELRQDGQPIDPEPWLAAPGG